MSETAQYMIHNASGGAQGTASEIESTAEALKQIDTILAQNYSNKTGKSVEEIKVLMNKTTYMTPQEAKSLGFVDAVRMPVAAFGNFNPNINIVNLQIQIISSKNIYVGLIGQCDSCNLDSINISYSLVNCSSTTSLINIGSIVGYIYNVTIRNCNSYNINRFLYCVLDIMSLFLQFCWYLSLVLIHDFM